MSTTDILRSRLRERRLALGRSQENVAAALGHSQPWLANIENGSRNPSLDDLEALCCALGVTHTIGVATGKTGDDPLAALRDAIESVNAAAAGLAPAWGAAWHEREALSAGSGGRAAEEGEGR